MLHHLTLWVPDIGRARESWSWLLEELGYRLDPPVDGVVVLRHPEGPTVALEQSSDMVPGMLYSRMRPGVNHFAFIVPPSASLTDIVQRAGDHGWSTLASDRHRLVRAAEVAYLEDRDGFEVELVAPVT